MIYEDKEEAGVYFNEVEDTVYLEIFIVNFILRDEEFAKIRSRIKLNATFNNTSTILITQILNRANISDTKFPNG